MGGVDNANLELDDDCSKHDFFSNQLSTAYANSDSVNIEYGYLIHEQSAGDWTIYLCANCETAVYASKTIGNPSQILVNSGLQTNSAKLEQKMKDPRFSQVYRIILFPHSQSGRTMASTRNEEIMAEIQEGVNSFLISKKVEMEERIMKFEADERATFEELKANARKEKNLFSSIVLQIGESDSGISLESSSDAIQLGPRFSQDGSHPSAVSSVPHKLRDRQLPAKPRPRTHTEESDTLPTDSIELEFDDIYTYDPDIEVESDGDEADDDSDDDDCLMMRDVDDEPVFRNNDGLLSTSMPMPIMQHFPHHISSKPSGSVLVERGEPHPVNIAESMKQLSFMMQPEEQQLFEKPRPRLRSNAAAL